VENLTPTAIRSMESIDRLHYPGPGSGRYVVNYLEA
jgi:hypothetical protein